MDIFNQLDQITDSEASSKKVLHAHKTAHVDNGTVILSDRIPAYKERTLGFIKRYEVFTGVDFDHSVDSYKSMAQWLVENVSPSVSRRSWSKYRLSVASSTEHPAIHDILKTGTGYKRNTRPSRFKRQKHLSDNHLSRLTKALSESSSPYKQALTDWLRAGRYTGLRPNEWSDATVVYPDGLTPTLKVKTKIKKPANRDVVVAPYRYIPVSHLSPIDMDSLYSHIRRYTKADSENKAEALYESCRKLLYNTVRITFRADTKAKIHLYSARHQFCADLKASCCDNKLIIRLMGQNSEEVLRHHYARKSAGVQTSLNFELAASFNSL